MYRTVFELIRKNASRERQIDDVSESDIYLFIKMIATNNNTLVKKTVKRSHFFIPQPVVLKTAGVFNFYSIKTLGVLVAAKMSCWESITEAYVEGK